MTGARIRTTALTVLGFRVAYGVGLVVAPTRLARRWLGPAAGAASHPGALARPGRAGNRSARRRDRCRRSRGRASPLAGGQRGRRPIRHPGHGRRRAMSCPRARARDHGRRRRLGPAQRRTCGGRRELNAMTIAYDRSGQRADAGAPAPARRRPPRVGPDRRPAQWPLRRDRPGSARVRRVAGADRSSSPPRGRWRRRSPRIWTRSASPARTSSATPWAAGSPWSLG